MAVLKFSTRFDGSKLQAGLATAKSKVKSLGATMRAEATSMAKQWGSVGVMAGVTAGAAIASREAREAIAYGSKVSDMALSMGITNERLQELEFIAVRGGAALEDIQRIFLKIGQSSAKALKGSKDVAGAYERFGITQRDLQSLSPDALFLRLSEAMAKAPRDLQFFDDAMRVMGRTAIKVLPMMALNFQAVAKEARGVGAIMSNETIDSLDTLEDRLQELGVTIQAWFGRGAVKLADAFEFGDREANMLTHTFEGLFGSIWASATDKDITFLDAFKDAAKGIRQAWDDDDPEKAKERAREQALMIANEKRRTQELERQAEALAEQRKLNEANAKSLETSLKKLEGLEFARRSPAEQKAILEKRLKVAQQEAAIAETHRMIAVGTGGIAGDPMKATDEAAQKRIAVLELEGKLKSVAGTQQGMRIGQDSLAKTGMFRGMQTEEAIFRNQELAQLKQINAAAFKIENNTKKLDRP